MYVYVPQVQVPTEAREGCRSPEAGVTRDCEYRQVAVNRWEPNIGPREEQYAL